MALDFPTSPTDGQTYTLGNRAWRWNGSAWDIVSASSVTFTASSTAPSNPLAGDRWLDLSTGVEYTYVNDGNTSQWIDLNVATVQKSAAETLYLADNYGAL